MIARKFCGGPVRVETIAVGLSVVALFAVGPAHVGTLLMSEVLIGAVSAALLASETLTPLELAGGALVLCAGVMEVWPVRQGSG